MKFAFSLEFIFFWIASKSRSLCMHERNQTRRWRLLKLHYNRHQNLIWSFHPRDFRVYRDIGLSDNYNPTIVLYDDCNSVLDKVAARILRCIITNALIMGRMKNRDFTGWQPIIQAWLVVTIWHEDEKSYYPGLLFAYNNIVWINKDLSKIFHGWLYILLLYSRKSLRRNYYR